MLSRSSADTNEQSLKAFLAKPTILASGSFATTDTFGTFGKFTCPHDLLQNPIFLNKLAGFLGFRATIVLRLQVNANKFQQGRYMLCFTHTGGSNPTTAVGVLNYNAHTNTLTARTQLPHVELDLSCDTEAILKIPYTSCQNYTPMSAIIANNGFGAIGTAQVFPYSALIAPTGVNVAYYTIWVSFEDVELITAAAPQSGRMMTGRSISEKEADSKNLGPISSTMVKIRDASRLFIPVPGISSYASSLSWVADISANAASIFGWSKPINMDTLVKTERQTLSGYSHVNTADQGQVLAMNCKNAVDVLPGFSSTDTDEMDFSHIMTIPAWVSTTAWTTAGAVGTALATFAVHPLASRTTRTVTGAIVITDHTPMTFIADYFNMWRGSIVYTFKFVKTEYHSGRVAICFFPHEDYVSTSTRSLNLSNYIHREIVDIRECSTITVAIPFVSSSPYRPLRNTGLSVGNVVIYVLDPLSAPSSVSSTISILAEVSAGPDMEFAIPRSYASTPVMNATPQSGGMMTAAKAGASECGIYNGTIGGTQISHDPSLNASACIGEKITSFRTLIKSMNLINYVNQSPISQLKAIEVTPFAANVFYVTASTPYPYNSGDLYSALCGCYALSRGGVRLKFIAPGGNTGGIAPVTYLATYDSGGAARTGMILNSSNDPLGGTNTTGFRLSGPVQFHNVSANFGAEVAVPQYHRYHSRANQDHYVNSNTVLNYTFANPSISSRSVVYYTQPGLDLLPRTDVARGGSDDINFGVFISVPPMQNALGDNNGW